MPSSERRHAKYNKTNNTTEFRVLRRSIDQKKNRAQLVDRFRKLHEGFRPELETVPESRSESQLQPHSKIQENKLQRWREEKKIKKLIQKKLEKPSFKICKIVPAQPIFLFSERHVNDEGKADMRVTRSMAKISESTKGSATVKTGKTNPSVELRKGASKLASGGITNKQCNKKPSSNKQVPKKIKPNNSHSNNVEESRLTRNERRSFAPPDFIFAAPAGIESYPLNKDNTGNSGSDAILSSKLSSLNTDSVNLLSSGEEMNNQNKTEKSRLGVFKSPASKILKEEQFSPLLDICPWITRTRGSSSRKKLKQAAAYKLDGTCDAKLNLVEEFNTVQPLEVEHAGSSDLTVLDTVQTNAEDQLTPDYFRCLLTRHSGVLTSLCEDWRPYLGNGEICNENVIGRIRTTIGQTELLMAERFQQFSNLIDDCEFERGEKPTTCLDLQGFWDMIYFQVEDVTKKFNELRKMKDQNFVELATSPVRRLPPRKVAKKTKAKKVNIEQCKADMTRSHEAQQRIAEAKARLAMRLRTVDNTSGVSLKADDAVGMDTANSLTRFNYEDANRKSINVMTSEALLPLLPFENLNVASPRKASTMRLSQLYSPLRDRTNIEDHNKSSSFVASDTMVNPHALSSATPFKKPNRISNLIRFSEVPKPMLDKENGGLLLNF